MILQLEKLTALAPIKEPKGKKRTAPDTARTQIEFNPGLLDLVRLRVAQIHDCYPDVQEQIKKLKAQGETGLRLSLLKDWRKQTIFSLREMAALNLAESLTHNPIDTVPDEVVHATSVLFEETEMICLTLFILAVNDWHYLNDSFAPPNLFCPLIKANRAAFKQLSAENLKGNSHDLPNRRR